MSSVPGIHLGIAGQTEGETMIRYEATGGTFKQWEDSKVTDLGNPVNRTFMESRSVYWTPDNATKNGDTVTVSFVGNKDNVFAQVTMAVSVQDSKYSLTPTSKTPVPQIPTSAPLTPQVQITSYLTDMMTAAYSPFYEGLRFEMSNYAEILAGKTITATFYWTMYHLNSGLDVSYEIGLEKYGNFSLQATAWLDGSGTAVPGTIKILSDTAVHGPAEYTVPIEDFFNDMPEPTQTQITAKSNSAAAAVARSYYAENGLGEIKGLTVIEISDLANRALKDESVSFGIDLAVDAVPEKRNGEFDASMLLTREFGGEWEIVDVVFP
jgi:hypothetical protein